MIEGSGSVSLTNGSGSATLVCVGLCCLDWHLSSVVDRQRFDADPDPTFRFDADPDPDPTLSFTHVRQSVKN
jgi:hypothetical protein